MKLVTLSIVTLLEYANSDPQLFEILVIPEKVTTLLNTYNTPEPAVFPWMLRKPLLMSVVDST